MIQSMSSLNSAMLSFESLKTINSVKTQMEGRANVLKSEIQTGGGNVEAKKEELAAQEEKISDVTDQLNQNLGKLTQELNKPLTQEEKEAMLEEKRAEEKKETEALQESQDAKRQAEASAQTAPSNVPAKDVFTSSGQAAMSSAAADALKFSDMSAWTGASYTNDATVENVPAVGENLNVTA